MEHNAPSPQTDRWQFSIQLVLLVITWVAGNAAISRFFLSRSSDWFYDDRVVRLLSLLLVFVVFNLTTLVGVTALVQKRRRALKTNRFRWMLLMLPIVIASTSTVIAIVILVVSSLDR